MRSYRFGRAAWEEEAAASTVPRPSRSRWPRPVTYLVIVLGVILVGFFLVILGGP